MPMHRASIGFAGVAHLCLGALAAVSLWLLFRAAHFSDLGLTPSLTVAVLAAAVAIGLGFWVWGREGGRPNYVAARRWVAGGPMPAHMSPAQLRTSLQRIEDVLRARWLYLGLFFIWGVWAVDRVRAAEGVVGIILAVLPGVLWGVLAVNVLFRARRGLSRISSLRAQTTSTSPSA
jgi:hypothetical protein